MRKIVLPIVGLTLLLALAGCMHWINPPVSEGIVRITIMRPATTTQGISPKWIPQQAQKVRVRIWNPDTGTNVVRSIALQTQSQTVAIPVPAETGYNVDAVAYTGTEALTGARHGGVNIQRGKTASVALQLAQWHSGFDKKSVQSGEVYSITCDLGGSTAPTAAIFDYGLLYIYSSQTSSAIAMESSAVVSNGKITLSGHAPTVTAPTPLYAVVKIALRPEWSDPAEGNARLWLEMPNQALGEKRHELMVNPATGALSVTISSK